MKQMRLKLGVRNRGGGKNLLLVSCGLLVPVSGFLVWFLTNWAVAVTPWAQLGGAVLFSRTPPPRDAMRMKRKGGRLEEEERK